LAYGADTDYENIPSDADLGNDLGVGHGFSMTEGKVANIEARQVKEVVFAIVN
jgi:hypothetical protein